MSLNIRKPDGTLQEIGKVTKEKVEAALGYEPANKSIETTVADNTTAINTHTENNDRHVTPADKQAWNEVTEVIEDIESEEFIIADPEGNKILQVDEDGLHTKIIDTEKVNLDGQDLAQKLSDLETEIEDAKIPSIEDNTDGKLEFTDPDGNIIARIDDQGLETHEVKAKAITIDDGSEDGINVKNKLDDVDRHIGDSTHLREGEREGWFSGKFDDLEDSPFTQDDSGKLTITDTEGNIVFEINSDGEGSTNVYSLAINGQPLEDFIKEVAPEPEVITDTEIIALVNEVFPEEV